jgi:hypothetical protein
MDIFRAFGTDPVLEKQGRYFELGDAEFLVARSGNQAYTDMFSQLVQAHKHTLDQRVTPEDRARANERAEKITVEVMSKTILLGWRPIVRKLADGTEVAGKIEFNGEDLTGAYSVANAAKLLAVKEFRNWVQSKSDDYKNFLVATQEEDEKNSEATSAGS